jgi:hypothetical protein
MLGFFLSSRCSWETRMLLDPHPGVYPKRTHSAE